MDFHSAFSASQGRRRGVCVRSCLSPQGTARKHWGSLTLLMRGGRFTYPSLLSETPVCTAMRQTAAGGTEQLCIFTPQKEPNPKTWGGEAQNSLENSNYRCPVRKAGLEPGESHEAACSSCLNLGNLPCLARCSLHRGAAYTQPHHPQAAACYLH